MVRAWYIDADKSNPRDEHQRLPPKYISLEDLYSVSGVEYHELNVQSYLTDGSWDKIKKKRGYKYEDELVTPQANDLKTFYTEHLNQDEEIRFVLEGCGYYDVRDNEDEWIRVEVVAGDLIVIPGGCYHRFMLDNKNLFKAKRLFRTDQTFSRPADDMDCRRQYIKNLSTGVFKNS